MKNHVMFFFSPCQCGDICYEFTGLGFQSVTLFIWVLFAISLNCLTANGISFLMGSLWN